MDKIIIKNGTIVNCGQSIMAAANESIVPPKDHIYLVMRKGNLIMTTVLEVNTVGVIRDEIIFNVAAHNALETITEIATILNAAKIDDITFKFNESKFDLVVMIIDAVKKKHAQKIIALAQSIIYAADILKSQKNKQEIILLS